ncbi:MAG: hypothetical protein AB1603_08445 [Chloroflexota bacterium]
MNVLRERMRNFLSTNRVGVLTVSLLDGAWAMPVRYRAENLELYCLVPRWADIAYYVERHPRVLMVVLVVLTSHKAPLCWLQYKGNARPLANPDWSGLLPEGVSEGLAKDMYLVLRIAPERIDLLDESRGWGARETLEIEGNT